MSDEDVALIEQTLIDYQSSPAYWNGWLAGTVKNALRQLEAIDSDGELVFSRETILHEMHICWQAYMDSPVGIPASGMDEELFDGFIVESADGEAQAMRDTYEEARKAIPDVEDYWYSAETCGHPDAPGFVAKLRPFRVRQITKAERLDLEEYPPTIDREGG